MFFPQTYQLVATQLVEDAVVVVRGRVDRREDQPRLVAMELSAARPVRGPARARSSSRCRWPGACRRWSTGSRRCSATHPGVTEVHLQLQQRGGRTTVMRLDDRLRVTPGPALFGDLKALLGPGSVE